MLVGKYTKFEDSYISVIKSLKHAAMFSRKKLNLKVRVITCTCTMYIVLYIIGSDVVIIF